MATIVRGHIPADEFVLEETLTSLEDVEFECERIVTSGDEAVMPLLWVRGVDGDEIEQAFQEDSTVENVDLLSSFENEWLYRMEWVDRVQLVVQMLTNSEATVMDAYGTSEQWDLRVLYPSRDALSKTTEFGEDHGLTFEIETIRQMEGEPAGRYGLSRAQYEALTQALEEGYYQVPRENNLEDIADDLDISHQALSERIRRATQTLIEETVLVGP
jgi:predicted DNA binding protein